VVELADPAGGSDSEAMRRELDGLMAIMESHFRYEERAIGGAQQEYRAGNTPAG